MSEPNLLIVDDERSIRDPLGDYLRKNGYRVTLAESALAARRLLTVHAFDLVVLDVMMPGEDGFSLCRHIREAAETPVILLTAKAEETDRIVGLELGADDYVVKPFSPRELLARIKAVLRRAHGLPPRQTLGDESYAFGAWVLKVGARELVDLDGVVTPLSTGEFNLLLALVARPNLVLTREQLLDLTQGRDAVLFDRSIDNQISRLRRKIEADPKDPKLIKTVWGGGYVFAGEVRRL